MDIFAGIFAYLAGIGALFAALAQSFSVFVSSPNQAIQPQSQPQSATAMVVRPSTPNKPSASNKPSAPSKAATVEASSKPIAAAHSEKQVPVASSDTAQPATPAKLSPHKASASAARLRRLVQEERARRWAYQQDPSFESRFLGYAD